MKTETLLKKFNDSGNELRNAMILKIRTVSHEKNYNAAYKKLVVSGNAFKLKKKYMA